MKIIPLYKFESRILVGLDSDYEEASVEDGLVVEIDIEKKEIINPPWSGQKKLKFGFYYPVEPDDRNEVVDLILKELDESIIIEIENLLMNPSQDAINSLIWVPDRLKS